MLTADQVTGWPALPLDEAAREARANGRTLREEIRTGQAALERTSRWRGAARGFAASRFAEEVDHVEEVSRVLAAFADAAEDAGAELSDGRERVLRLAAEADVARGGAGGRPADDVHSFAGTEAENREAVDEADARLRAALTALDETDRRHAARLDALVADLTAMVHGHVDVLTPEGRRDPDAVVTRLAAMTPQQRRDLLARMSTRDIDRLVAANPGVLGNLDGVPFAVRIAANRRAIEEALEAQVRRGVGDGPRARQLREMLGTIADPHAPHRRVRRQFVAFANTPSGRAIEMFGAVRPTTTSVAVYVPGTGTKLDTAGANRTAAWNFANRSGSPVFLYLDGQFPPDLPSALSSKYAMSMAPRLVEFGRSLDAEVAAHAPAAATVYLGHSYGGAVVGTAEQLGLRADRVVYASASGTGMLPGGADAWSNPAGPQRFSITPPGDPIHPIQSSGVHGGDPDTARGVTRMDSGDYADGQRVRGRHGHGAYFDDPDSDAFANMVAVIRGRAVRPYVPREPDVPGPG
ncbi:MAG: hypothetical protein QM634_02980 [Gordonia sp. (in: high G+C Gram-positive bacteria)]